MADPSTSEADEEDTQRDRPPRREAARRLFAAEFNDAQHETQGEGEYDPSYVITPLGAKVNRVFAVGVLTSNDPTGDDGSMQRAQITDPTGVFYVYAGSYQPEALETLRELDPPQIVGVVGKARTYENDEGQVYTSIRPETIHPMSSEDRDAWILETAESTVERVRALDRAFDLEEEVSRERLVEEGVDEDQADGIMEALSAYGRVDLPSYLSLVSDALGYLLPAPPEPEIMHAGEGEEDQSAAEEPGIQEAETPAHPEADSMPSSTDTEGSSSPEPAAQEATSESGEADEVGSDADVDPEAVVFELVEELDDGEGAPWEEIVEQAQAEGLSEEEVEETMNLLMDRGRVFEPVLGKLKAT